MGFSVRVAEYLRKIKSYGKENLADILHEIGEVVPLITHQSRFRLYLEDLTGGILTCVLARGRIRQVVRNYVFPSLMKTTWFPESTSIRRMPSLPTGSICRLGHGNLPRISAWWHQSSCRWCTKAVPSASFV